MWIILTLLSAVSLAVVDLLTRKYSGEYDVMTMSLGRIIFAVPLLWMYALYQGIPDVSFEVVYVIFLSLPIEFLAMVLYVYSLKFSPLSLTVPFLSFTPLFLLFTSPVILGEWSKGLPVPGILLIIAGAFFLNIHTVKGGILEPVRAIIKEKGSLLMLLTAFCYSITSNYGKMGLIFSSPAFFAAVYSTLLTVIFIIIAVKKKTLFVIFNRRIMIIGIFSAVMFSAHMAAINLVQVSYMISVKRSSMLFGIILGWLFLGERHIRERMAGAVLMLAGIIVIFLFS